MVYHAAKRRVKEHLIESGLLFTILQPSTFLDNILIARLIGEPVSPEIWKLNTRFSFTTLRDNAETLHRVLMEREEHFLAQFSIISTKQATSNRDVLFVARKKINKEIEIKPLKHDEKADFMLKRVSDPGVYAKETVGLRAKYYSANGKLCASKVLQIIIGREPMQVAEWVDWTIEQAQRSSWAACVGLGQQRFNHVDQQMLTREVLVDGPSRWARRERSESESNDQKQPRVCAILLRNLQALFFLSVTLSCWLTLGLQSHKA